jgi:hypothetical protein
MTASLRTAGAAPVPAIVTFSGVRAVAAAEVHDDAR